MDLSQIQIKETLRIHIEHPTKGPLYQDEARSLPCVIEIYSPASDQAVQQQREARRRMGERLGKKGMKALSMSAEELENTEIDRLIALTCSVEGIEIDGEPITAENAGKLYRDSRFGWIKEQVAEHLGDWESFLS